MSLKRRTKTAILTEDLLDVFGDVEILFDKIKIPLRSIVLAGWSCDIIRNEYSHTTIVRFYSKNKKCVINIKLNGDQCKFENLAYAQTSGEMRNNFYWKTDEEILEFVAKRIKNNTKYTPKIDINVAKISA